MRILLDTHIFLYYISADKRLPDSLRDDIQNTTNEIYLSVVSVWEITVKYQLGKLPLPESPVFYIPEQRKKHSILSLSLDEGSTSKLLLLPDFHRDPFDRMLICQSLHHSLFLATLDSFVRSYPIKVLP
ncbi:MAG: type II toxin-antitoxin system VapC family toxin [Blastocatellia bacterium]